MAKTFLQVVNDVLGALRKDPVTNVNETVLSRLATLYANQQKQKVENAILWRVFRHTEQVAFDSADLEKAIPNSTERTRLYKIPGKRPRLYDITDHLATPTIPKDKVWDLDVDKVREIQEENVVFTFDSASYFAVEIDQSGQTCNLLRDTKTSAARTVQVDVWTPQPDLDVSTQNTIVKVPTLPIIHGATYMVLQERGEELGIDGDFYLQQHETTLRDAVGIEESAQGGWEVESDTGRHDVLRRQW